MDNLKIIIRKHALKNALDYSKANSGSVAGKVIAEFPDAKNDMKSVMQQIAQAVTDVNKMKKPEIESELLKYEFAEKPKEEKKGFDVTGAMQGKVITRFPPEPSGYPHIGHAKAAFLDYEIAKQYGGHMILRFDDTNPEKESAEYVDAIKSGLRWLGIEWSKETYTSDRIPEIYKVAEKLIDLGKAYVCICSGETISENRTKSKACECRGLGEKDQLARWKQMLDGKAEPGKMVLRYKGNLSALNTVMRDPSLARVLEAKHYRQGNKYHVWPSYDLAVTFMDHAEGITHPARSKEYELRDELYLEIFDVLGWQKPNLIGFSRLSIKNAPISKRLLTPLVQEKKVLGWDDPRLPTLVGLKRRGILPEAIRTFVLSFGLSKVESEPDLEALLAENKKLLDPIANRYYFVADPVELEVIDAPEETVQIKLHPKLDHGVREVETTDTFFISRSDADTLEKDETFRLKELFNVEVNEKKEDFIAGTYAGDEKVAKKFQWVGEDRIECEILVAGDLLKDEKFNPDSLKIVKGYCEKNCEALPINVMIQFERFGFVRLDKKEKDKMTFVYSC